MRVESGTFSKSSTRSNNDNIFDAVTEYLQRNECLKPVQQQSPVLFCYFCLWDTDTLSRSGFKVTVDKVIVIRAGSGHLPLCYAALG